MPFSEVYERQVVLLIRSLPYVAEEECFALKGGSAINLFVRDMPRLSVDIDLTYVPVAPRNQSLREIDAAMKRISKRISTSVPKSQVRETKMPQEDTIHKLFVRVGGVQVKIEVTPVLRGCVFEPKMARVSRAVEDAYGFAEINTVSFPDLYGGKIVAALDRQHPRDLFDIYDLLDNEGIDEDLRATFIVYLISHHRPMHEVLDSPQKDISDEFAHGFEGMTAGTIDLSVLIDARDRLTDMIIRQMPDDHRRFLILFERGQPEWSLINVGEVEELPAVRWRLQNLDSLDGNRRATLVAALEDVLAKS